jgi:predicted O-methyltransferase YrrM
VSRRALMLPQPEWVRAGIGEADAGFLLELIAREAPARVLELGVAAGTSSAAILFALDQLPEPEQRVLHSADLRAVCYFSPQHATGAAVAAIYPDHRAQWRLDVNTDGRRLRQRVDPGSADVIFIDANHQHPWPLLDVLHLAPCAKPGAWIALHDIRLPELYPEYPEHGAMWLFDEWPFDKLAGTGPASNTGAVRLPENLAALLPMAIDLIGRRKWEQRPRGADVDLPEPFRRVHGLIAPELRGGEQ